jgi:hypothetical protein
VADQIHDRRRLARPAIRHQLGHATSKTKGPEPTVPGLHRAPLRRPLNFRLVPQSRVRRWSRPWKGRQQAQAAATPGMDIIEDI